MSNWQLQLPKSLKLIYEKRYTNKIKKTCSWLVDNICHMLDLCKEVGQEVPLVLPALCCARQVMRLLWISPASAGKRGAWPSCFPDPQACPKLKSSPAPKRALSPRPPSQPMALLPTQSPRPETWRSFRMLPSLHPPSPPLQVLPLLPPTCLPVWPSEFQPQQHHHLCCLLHKCQPPLHPPILLPHRSHVRDHTYIKIWNFKNFKNTQHNDF